MRSFVFRNAPAVCPNCDSASIHRSRRTGLHESLLHWVLFISPYRCKDCDYRHFRFRFRLRQPGETTLKHHQHHPA
jgi:predicted Zn-ribbon and HTH transcriptional regulator